MGITHLYAVVETAPLGKAKRHTRSICCTSDGWIRIGMHVEKIRIAADGRSDAALAIHGHDPNMALKANRSCTACSPHQGSALPHARGRPQGRRRGVAGSRIGSCMHPWYSKVSCCQEIHSGGEFGLQKDWSHCHSLTAALRPIAHAHASACALCSVNSWWTGTCGDHLPVL